MHSSLESDPKIIRMLILAIKESKKSTYKHKVGAIITKGKRVLSKGHNEIRHKAMGSSKYTEWETSLHAERMACTNIDKEKLKGTTIYIGRELKDGSFALAAPCKQCKRLIEDMGIKKVIFSIPEEPYYEVIKL